MGSSLKLVQTWAVWLKIWNVFISQPCWTLGWWFQNIFVGDFSPLITSGNDPIWRTQLLTGAVVVAAASVERRVERPQKPREGPWRKGQNPNDGLEKWTCVYIHISESVYMHTYIQIMYSLFVLFQGFVHGTTRKDDTCLSFLVASWLSLAICGQLTIGTDEWQMVSINLFTLYTPENSHETKNLPNWKGK